MKHHTVLGFLLAATLSPTLSVADVLLDPLPLTVNSGDTYEIKWSTNHNYSLELLFVRKGDAPNIAWSVVDTLFEERIQAAGSGCYNWTVPVTERNGSYGLWLSGEGYPKDGTGYANLTRWFEIEAAGSGIGETHSVPAQVAL